MIWDKIKVNKTIINLVVFGLFLLFFAFFIENANAVLLEPSIVGGEEKTPSGYIQAIYKLTIGIAGVLAVLMIVTGGLEYISSAANPNLKASAKTRIWSAIGGLLIALTAYLILNTINPDLVNFDLQLKKINIPTLLIWGERDEDAPLRLAHEINNLIKDSELKVIENAGHNVFLDKPNLFFGYVQNYIKNISNN